LKFGPPHSLHDQGALNGARMNQLAKVKAIYRELRQSVGVMACAASMAELFSVDEEESLFDTRLGCQPFDMMAVDVALADGGWRKLSREWRRMGWESTDTGR
jgi:hypothetical protein